MHKSPGSDIGWLYNLNNYLLGNSLINEPAVCSQN